MRKTPLLAFVVIGAAAALHPDQARAQCAPGDMLVEQTEKGAWCAKRLYKQSDFSASDEALIQSMVKFGGSPAERYRLDNALHTLGRDPPFTPDRAQVQSAWNSMRGRAGQERLKQAAAAGQGPGAYAAGTQAAQDCAVYALANAAGVPYSAAAAKALDLISKAPWRSQHDRDNPKDALERRGGGLNGGEVIIMAEGYGRAVVVKAADFVSTLQQGRPIMLGVSVPGGAHEIVLSKTFQLDGQTWFEVVDSNQKDPTTRIYATAAELAQITNENGVSYRADPNTVAPVTPR